MKKLFTAIAITAFTFVGTSVNADARPHRDYSHNGHNGHYSRGYNQPASTIYISGYRHGRPVYTQKYFIGYDRCGTPRWGYRTVSAPNYRNRGNSCGTPQRNLSHGKFRSAGSSVHFRFGR
jgi:hypothetical protein